MENNQLTFEEKLNEVFKIVLKTKLFLRDGQGGELPITPLDFSTQDFRMKDLNMPNIDVCPFYRKNDV